MRRRRLAVVAVLAALVVTLAAVATASHTASVVASQHTDFGTGGESAPKTLDNVTVDGSGDAAEVTFAVSNYNPVIEEGDGTTDTDRFFIGDRSDDSTVDAEAEIVPKVSGELETVAPIISTTTGSDYGFTVTVRIVQESPDGMVGEGTVLTNSWDPAFSTGKQEIDVSSAGFHVDQGTNYTLEFITGSSDSDGTGDRLQIQTDQSASTNWYWSAGSFHSDYPNIYANVSAPERGVYVGANHTVGDATTAKVNLSTLTNAEAIVSIDEHDGTSWSQVSQKTFTTPGNKSIDVSAATNAKLRTNVTVVNQTGNGDPSFRLGDESILFTARSPDVDNASASPTGDLTSFQNTYTIDVTDADFPLAQSDTLTAELFIDGVSQGTDTLNSNGTASVTATTSTGGSHTYHWVVTDSYGLSHQSQDFTVRIPDTIELFNETQPQSKLTTAGTATVRSFAQDVVIENTTSNGELDLTGFPVDQTFVVKVELANFHDTTVIVEDIYQQQKIWLLNTTIASNQVRFTLTDRTGNFEQDPKLIIQRPLNHTGAGAEWVTIRADEFGAAGVTTNLETDTRYRLIVENNEGDQRTVGPYTTSVDETVDLQVGSSTLNLTTEATAHVFNATYQNASGTEQIVWGYNDTDGLTTDLTVTIYEFKNQSNQIYSKTFGPQGTVTATVILTGDQPNKSWTVDWSATRDGETIGGKVTVGRFVDEQVAALPAWLQEAVALIALMLTAGLFTQRNFAAGAVITSLEGGVFWMAGWLPGVTSGAGIAGALALAVLYKWARDVR